MARTISAHHSLLPLVVLRLVSLCPVILRSLPSVRPCHCMCHRASGINSCNTKDHQIFADYKKNCPANDMPCQFGYVVCVCRCLWGSVVLFIRQGPGFSNFFSFHSGPPLKSPFEQFLSERLGIGGLWLGGSPPGAEVWRKACGPSRLHAGMGGHAVWTVLAASLSWNALVFRPGRQSKTTWGRRFRRTFSRWEADHAVRPPKSTAVHHASAHKHQGLTSPGVRPCQDTYVAVSLLLKKPAGFSLPLCACLRACLSACMWVLPRVFFSSLQVKWIELILACEQLIC